MQDSTPKQNAASSDVYSKGLLNISGKVSSSETAKQKSSDEEFYENLFVHSSVWSTPFPNSDETARWQKIQPLLEELCETLKWGSKDRLRILDLGCGRGWLTNLASDYGYAEGVEPVEGVIEHAKKLFPHLRFHACMPEELLNLPDFQPFDLVLTSEVIEHVPYNSNSHFVQVLRRLIRPEGGVILTTPRKEVFDQWNKFSTPNQPVEDWITEADLLSLFEAQNFRCIGHNRIYFDTLRSGYIPQPSSEHYDSTKIFGLYQIWSFRAPAEIALDSVWVSDADSSQKTSGHVPVIPLAISTPKVSVIVPTFNRPNSLRVTLNSILAQTLQEFEVIVINDGGEDVAHVVGVLNNNQNITYIKHAKNRGLAAARNSGIGVARGKYIAYLDDDDWYHPNHLETLITFLEESHTRVAYSDAYRVCQRRQGDQYVTAKKDLPYSVDFTAIGLLVTNYFPVLCVIHEKSCLQECGYFDESLTSHEDWDLWIRMSRVTEFVHIKEVTAEYSCRADGTSMTSSHSQVYLENIKKIHHRYREYVQDYPEIMKAQKENVQRLFERNVKSTSIDCSIIIPVFNNVEFTQLCLAQLALVTDGVGYEVIIVDNNSTDETNAFLKTLKGDVQIIRNEANLGFGKACNQGASAAKGKYLVFLDIDTIPQNGWLKSLVEEAETSDDVAIVGSKLLSTDGTIQHAGIAFSRNLLTPYHIYRGLPDNGMLGNKRRVCQAVTGACMLVKRLWFDQAERFHEGYRNRFEDIDLCLKIGELGGKVVYQPKSWLYHFESQSLGQRTHEEDHSDLFLETWKEKLYGDEDLIAFEDGIALETDFSVGLVRYNYRTLEPNQDFHAWKKVADLQHLVRLLTKSREPHSQSSLSEEIRALLRREGGWPKDVEVQKWLGLICMRFHLNEQSEIFFSEAIQIKECIDTRKALAKLI